jgi:exonuclease III
VQAELDEVHADVALLQEAALPAESQPGSVFPDPIDPETWQTAGRSRSWGRRTAVVKLSDRYEMQAVPLTAVGGEPDAVPVSHSGALAIANVEVGEEIITVASLYAPWERSLSGTSYADASAHRLLSDLSALLTTASNHRVIAAGDLNILHGYGEHGDPYWGARYQSVFDRAKAMGLRFVGPQHPHGRRAEPSPQELPEDSDDVDTYRHRHDPAAATRQVDFVLASPHLEERLTVTALNEPDAWGPSDHCRILIDLDATTTPPPAWPR